MWLRVSIFFLILFLPSVAWAAGARVAGMGGAYVGLSDDASSLFLNPAGLSSLKRFSFISMYAQPQSKTNSVLLGGILTEVFSGKLALGYNGLLTSGITITTPVTTEAASVDQTFYFSFARNISFNFSLGANLKIFSFGFDKDYSSLSAAKGSGVNADLGIKFSPKTWLGIGAFWQNFLSEGLGGKILGRSIGDLNNLKLGISLKPRENLSLAIDFEKTLSRKGPILSHLGVEWWPVKTFGFRGGLDQTTKSESETYSHFTLGLGLKFRGLTFDYALYRKGDELGGQIAYFSLGYLPEEEVKGVIPTAEAKPLPKLERKYFKDVPQDYWVKDPIEILAGLGIISGYPDGTFKPQTKITRVELLVVLIRALGIELPKVEKSVFKDVLPGSWIAPYIHAPVYLVTGYPDRTFKPKNSITRAEAVGVIARFDKLSTKRLLEKPFPDVPGRHWAAREITAAKETGLLKYLEGKKFQPKLELTRAEAAEIIFKTNIIKEKLSKYSID